MRGTARPRCSTRTSAPLVETKADIELALAHTDVKWCLDTGHLYIGGSTRSPSLATTPTVWDWFTSRMSTLRWPIGWMAGELTPHPGGSGRPVHAAREGDVAVGDAIVALEQAGYTGWYILEQDTA